MDVTDIIEILSDSSEARMDAEGAGTGKEFIVQPTNN